MTPDRFDLAVIGAGPGGVAAAVEAARRGARVALVERDQPGGTCLNWGCIPTKTLLATADLAHRAAHGAAMGLTAEGVGVNWPAVLARRDQIVARLVEAHRQEFKHEGIEFRQATARLVARDRIALSDAGEIEAKRVILATGSRPGALPGLTPDGDRVLNSDHALTLPALPTSLLIIGGGVIGCEFASLFADLGVTVTLVETLPALLALTDIDADATRELQRTFKKRKIKMHLGAGVERLDVNADGVTATLSDGARVEAERALVSVGRRLNTDNLGLEEIGVARGDHGEVIVDEHLATSVEGVHAIGDMTGQAQLAHLATHHGLVAARHALGDAEARCDRSAVPAVVFTRPSVAAVGMSEAAAREAGLDSVTGKCALRALGKAHVAGELDGVIKIVAARADGRVLGVHMVGAGVEEMIAEAALVVRHGLTLAQITDTIHPHPTLSEGLWEAARAALR